MYILFNPQKSLYYKGWDKWTKKKDEAVRYFYESSAEFIADRLELTLNIINLDQR